ncbi:hemerythrin-like metal-binding protein [Variovorax paradoxus]|uniref:Hemerythrin-like metal-binding protein n=1 Tax=Variovorax paradoxus TaxID=34073 RepID=A0AAE3Y0I8_VARPD|nr:hemerythrin [Variovorax paradoxus]MDR6427452.1 hemerythrin-like metal-binding protein [Variovorax paradoxus]
MAMLDRSDGMPLGLPFMERARERFAWRLAQVDEAADAALPGAWRELLAYAAEHFACEDIWMRASGFASRKDHAAQHRVVVEVMREGAVHATEGRLAQVREMACQLRDWYERHVRTMDAPLARHLRTQRSGRRSAGAQPRDDFAARPPLRRAGQHALPR